jgi:hypothetical protein
VVKVIYDRAAGKVRVTGQRAGRTFARTFLMNADLAEVLQQAAAYVREETGH